LIDAGNFVRAVLFCSEETAREGSRMWNFLAGTVCGVVLSISYVWYDVALPEWAVLPDTVKKSLNAAAVDDALVDPAIPEATRRRALEVYFANQAERAAVLEAELGYPLTRAIQNRRLKRAAQRLRAQWSGYDEVLKQPALRETMSNKYGASDDDKLKRHMLMAALQEKPVLAKWLKSRARTPSASNVLELVTEVSRLPQASSCEDGKH
jgi:hypothetical protein